MKLLPLLALALSGCASWDRQPTNADTQALVDCQHRAIKPGLSCLQIHDLQAGCYSIWQMKRRGPPEGLRGRE